MKKKIIVISIVLLVTTASCQSGKQKVYLANGIKIAEVTHNSAIIWSRATAVEKQDKSTPKFKYETDPLKIPKDYQPIPKGLTLTQMEGAVPGKAGKIHVVAAHVKVHEITVEIR